MAIVAVLQEKKNIPENGTSCGLVLWQHVIQKHALIACKYLWTPSTKTSDQKEKENPKETIDLCGNLCVLVLKVSTVITQHPLGAIQTIH